MPVAAFDQPLLERLCAVAADTETGLTGSEIGRYLRECGIADPSPTSTKRHRLYDALRQRQHQDGCANNVLAFIGSAFNPVRHTDAHDYFERKRIEMNQVLIFAGLEFTPAGQFQQVTPVDNLRDAARRADRLRSILQERGVHTDVLAFCREELLVENYFHAVLEATKSVAEKIRTRTGLISDGSDLIDEAFSFKGKIPHLALTSLTTESEQGEQRGFMNLLKGLFGTFRNPTAHAPRITWKLEEQDALDILAIVSLAHRRIDRAVDAYRVSTGGRSGA